ncbi:MAG: hypothetical protein RIC16_07295 [Rhodospirillales bacterium]
MKNSAKWGRIRRAALGSVVLSIIAGASASAAELCNDQRQLAAFNVRQLQTDLMVASLSCGAETQYNAFVERFQPVLKVNGKALKSNFQKRFGGSAKAELNDYVTMLANLSSIDSISQGTKYCTQSLAAFERVLAVDPGALEAFAADWWNPARNIPNTDCRAEVTYAGLEQTADTDSDTQ